MYRPILCGENTRQYFHHNRQVDTQAEAQREGGQTGQTSGHLMGINSSDIDCTAVGMALRTALAPIRHPL